MKRCPNCQFPNIDSDLNCFKCGTSLPDEKTEESDQLELDPSELDPSSTTFDAQTNATTFIHTPIEDSHTEPQEAIAQTTGEACITSETSLLDELPPPLATKGPTSSTLTRILPKYKSLHRLGMASKLLGLVLGLVFILLSVGFLLLFPSIFSIALCILGICFGTINMLMGFIIAAVLDWLNDVECNQRKQQELMNHIYHKLAE